MIEESARNQPQVLETTIATQHQNLIRAFEILRKQAKMSQQMRHSNPQNPSSSYRCTKLLDFNPSDTPIDIRTERTLRAYWQLLDENYFRQIRDEDIRPVEAILGKTKRYLIDKQMYGGDQSFKEEMNNILSEEYFARQSDQENIINMKFINLFYSFQTNPNLTLKQAEEKRKQAKLALTKFHYKPLRNLSYRGKQDSQLKKNRLQEEYNLLESFKYISIEDMDQVSQQIAKLENQLTTVSNTNKQKLSVFFQKNQDHILDQRIAEFKLSSHVTQGHVQTSIDLYKIMQSISEYMAYQIKQLEICQISDSIAKITTISSNEILVVFESAMGISPKILTAKEFEDLNKRRDHSLYVFYNAGIKSLFSYICHNFDGFKRLCDDIKKNAYKSPGLVRGNSLDLKGREEQIFSEMEMCHQCKYILPLVNLKKCGYNSRKYGDPKFVPCFFSPVTVKDIHGTRGQTEKNRPNFHPQSSKNSYVYYGVENGDYVCGRYFCKACLDHYEKILGKLCPFCLKICNCVRCLRNETIIKMKTLYSHFGSIYDLQQESEFEKYYHAKEPLIRKKPINPLQPEEEKLRFYQLRLRMDDLRMIASMTKRREVVKAKSIELDQKIFREKLMLTPFWSNIRDRFEQLKPAVSE